MMMFEIFLGDLSQEKLFDILKPLLMEKKTGRLMLKGKEKGEVCLERGNIVDAKTAHSLGEGAFFEVMGWKTGKITFQPDVPTKEKNINIATEQLLLNWSYRKQEWEKIKEVVPSPHTFFRLSLEKTLRDRNMSEDQWNVLVFFYGMKTVSEVVQTLNLDEFKASKTIYQLVQAGLLEKAEDLRPPEKKIAGKNFFQTVENELEKGYGPIARFIIDETLIEFKETRDSLLQDQGLSFIEALGEKIPNELIKKEFLRGIIELLSIKK
jgi:hypothetical protein